MKGLAARFVEGLSFAVVVSLAASLGVRLAAKPDRAPTTSPSLSEAEPAGSLVPAPKPFDITDLEIPRWSHQNSKDWPVRFRTDLDLLAPLGNGGRNAGEWYVDFRKPDGPRHEEARAMLERREKREGNFGKVLPPDDPLLLEAEPWCDQATMTFYPGIFGLDGYATRITDLLLPLNFVRSWVARGLAADSTEAAMAGTMR